MTWLVTRDMGVTISCKPGPWFLMNHYGFAFERDDGEVKTFRKHERAEAFAHKLNLADARELLAAEKIP